MDQGTLQGIGTGLALLAFIGIFVWAYSARNKKKFDEAADLPFADEPEPPGNTTQCDGKE